MTEIITTNLSADDFKKIIADEMEKFKSQQPKPEIEPFIKLSDVAEILGVSEVTIHNWKKSGKIPYYKISDRLYFKESEILESVKKIERKTA